MARRFPSSGLLSSVAARYACVLLGLGALGLLAFKTLRVETDFSAFLPPSATPEQRLLVAQLREGLASRLMLVALQGADERTLTQASKALSAKLSKEADFDYVANGSLDQFAAQGEVLMRHRYALSPEVGAERFSVKGLRAALEEQLENLASPVGALTRTVLARDPTGEFFATLRQLDPGAMPNTRNGVWFSQDGQRAFLIAQTRAPGFDSVRQAAAMEKVRNALAGVNPRIGVTLSGPGVFAAESHRLIERDAWRLSILSGIAILAMLIFIYRSPFLILLVMTPTAFGLLIGVLAVQQLFGSVQAITLGFAATLIGEAVDYPSYLLLNTAQGETVRDAARRIGGTLTLAVLTTVASAVALTLSGFPGLAQLGVLTMIGITVAGLTTHRIIPWLLGERIVAFRRLPIPEVAMLARARWPRWVSASAILLGAAWLAHSYPAWWDQDLASISPVPAELRILDGKLRREMGAPEVSVFLASRGDSEAAALEAAQNALPALRQWKAAGWITGFDSPASYLPAPATQADRLRALPDAATLEKRLSEAMKGLVFRPDAFAPFLKEAAVARELPPVSRATYAGTPLGAKLNALVLELEGQWLALTPLGGVTQPDKLAAALTAIPASRLVNLREVSGQMLDNYRREAAQQASLGALLIVALLLIGLRSLKRAWRVVLPVGAALVMTVSLLVALGQRLGVFHLVALLLVLGIGLNYALFFERPPADADERARTRLALTVCSVSTVLTFGLLAWSATPVLNAIGSTVALGSVLSLVFAAVWARPREAML